MVHVADFVPLHEMPTEWEEQRQIEAENTGADNKKEG
jgi:hypothetical protein